MYDTMSVIVRTYPTVISVFLALRQELRANEQNMSNTIFTERCAKLLHAATHTIAPRYCIMKIYLFVRAVLLNTDLS